MPKLIPAAILESIFADQAPATLPLERAEVEQSENGLASYRWTSPCNELDSLWLSIKNNEIMLATRIFHTHIDAVTFVKEAPSPSHLPRMIVTEAIKTAAAIMSGDVVFSVDYTSEGIPTSYGMSPRDVLNPLRDGSIALGSQTSRFWDWQGEITAV